MDTKNIINLDLLSQVLIDLVCQCCQAIGLFSKPECHLYKDPENPLTEVDYMVQTLLERGIRQHWPALNIVGEEDMTYSSFPDIQALVSSKLEKIERGEKTVLLLPEMRLNTELKEEDLCVWIDPLDCTSGFASHRLHVVTILVGVSWKGQPILGVIGHPFKEQTKNYLFQPTITFGSPLLNSSCCFEYCLNSQIWRVIKPCRSENPKTALISCRKIKQKQEKIMKTLELTPAKISGAGYKCLQVILNKATAVLLMEAVTGKWDTCAADAIIRGLGGQIIKPNLQVIDYSPHSCPQNPDGFFITTDVALLARFRRAMVELGEVN